MRKKTARARKAAPSTRRKKQSPLDRYVTMLEAIAATPDANLSELAELCKLPFSTAHRVLRTLVESRLVVPSPARRGEHMLAPRLMRLLHTGLDEAWLRIIGQGVIDDLAQKLDDTCFINRLIAKEVVTVAWAAPEGGARGYLVPGITQPLHASASAKAILAYQPPDFIRDALPERLPKLCVATKTRLRDVLADFATVRAQGYATCWNEYESGVAAIACPVFSLDAGVIYSVGVTGLIDRLSRHPIEKYAMAIRSAADTIGRAVQYRQQKGAPGQGFAFNDDFNGGSAARRSTRNARREFA